MSTPGEVGSVCSRWEQEPSGRVSLLPLAETSQTETQSLENGNLFIKEKSSVNSSTQVSTLNNNTWIETCLVSNNKWTLQAVSRSIQVAVQEPRGTLREATPSWGTP